MVFISSVGEGRGERLWTMSFLTPSCIGIWVMWEQKCHLRRPAVFLGCAIYRIPVICVLIPSFAASASSSLKGTQSGSGAGNKTDVD